MTTWNLLWTHLPNGNRILNIILTVPYYCNNIFSCLYDFLIKNVPVTTMCHLFTFYIKLYTTKWGYIRISVHIQACSVWWMYKHGSLLDWNKCFMSPKCPKEHSYPSTKTITKNKHQLKALSASRQDYVSVLGSATQHLIATFQCWFS